MLMTILESGGADKLPRGSAVALFAMTGYVAAASVAAGIGDPGAGLFVLALGVLTMVVVDAVMWRDAAAVAPPRPMGTYLLQGPEDMPRRLGLVPGGHYDPIRRETPPALLAAPAPEPIAEPAVVDTTAAEPVPAPAADEAPADRPMASA